MPYVKFISGKRGTRRLARYLVKGGRDLARDFVNVLDIDREGTEWWQAMDAERAAAGNDTAAQGGAARTYEHIIVSLDERDDVPLEDFRDYITGFASRWFTGGGERSIGEFQVAVVYHNDNVSRAAAGKDGILHAHIVVNNTDLENGRRLSPRLTNGVVRGMRKELNDRAHALGWRAFAGDGASYSPAEMAARGLEPAPLKGFRWDRQAEPEWVKAEVAELGRQPEKPVAATTRRGTGVRKAPIGRSAHMGTIVLSDGTELEVPLSGRPAEPTPEERRKGARDGWTWKGDIRDRVDFALRISDNRHQFQSVLGALGVGMEAASDGEVIFVHPDGNSKRVRGDTLGDGYTGEAVARALASKPRERVQRASGGYLPDPMKAPLIKAVRSASSGTREGAEKLSAVRELIAYVLDHGVTSPEGFPDDRHGAAMAAFADEVGLFEDHAPAPSMGEMSPEQRAAYEHELRSIAGAGGTERSGSQEVPGIQRTREQEPMSNVRTKRH